jgi:hypothetical protein
VTRCRNRLAERAEFLDQLFGERLDVALREGAEQYEFEQFVIADLIGARCAKAAAQPLAVAVVMGHCLGKAVRLGRIAALSGHEMQSRF